MVSKTISSALVQPERLPDAQFANLGLRYGPVSWNPDSHSIRRRPSSLSTFACSASRRSNTALPSPFVTAIARLFKHRSIQSNCSHESTAAHAQSAMLELLYAGATPQAVSAPHCNPIFSGYGSQVQQRN
ncbi:hypothetical protein BAUCODRAFT_122605 [Baudoinia panamericana UAMH 10762]|uniref:Uncharacterized protein n=1 Tax=Baudoinia panamericana (strain UAMH 10762) TaxID=717646 RepID=M2LQC8_BAUPA|nr:uncharacterized protein BAUCODRAFT_122605 [Baudoinia panamericana UAMH 10762]EMC96622.1 hypothetical protein BAUCODRAFT_122605 [Baudoinia panamericana UAMH 10762]